MITAQKSVSIRNFAKAGMVEFIEELHKVLTDPSFKFVSGELCPPRPGFPRWGFQLNFISEVF